MADKELFIRTVQMVEVDGSWNIPTAVLYNQDGSVIIGNSAFAEANGENLINEDFKIDLGRFDPALQTTKRQYMTAANQSKSALQISDDFLYEIQKIVKKWLVSRGVHECKNLVVAEPLSMHTEDVSPDWLVNYRKAVRRLIEGKTVLSSTGVSVRFIPEPFAAFQYYRHGIRHALVSQRTQMNALVIDFGGGTCDVCIIQTTKDGDISGSGLNKRPLAGKSLPIGGFAINRAIAEHLIRKTCGRLEAAIKTGLHEYKDWHEGRRKIELIDKRYRNFITHFHRLVHQVESVKLALSRAVMDWDLSSDRQFSASLSVPTDPFDIGGTTTVATISITEFRNVFVQKIYSPHLKPFFADRFKAGKSILEEAVLTVILLSGGSANIGWLIHLLRRDFPEFISGVPVVQIPDYQEVVAQGLAVDCAREFATGTSDFKGVTYNPLFLLLDPDNAGCEPRAFTPRSPSLPDVRHQPGLLLPTASLLSSFINEPMQWKIKLSRPPRKKLDYFFLQSTLDQSDIRNRQNVEETTVHTPTECEFDSALQIQLTIRKDGTAVPKFIYRSASPSASENSKDGRKFFIDMTDASGGFSEAYIGLDFGSSNTAISYVDRAWVRLIEDRSRDAGWKELGELVELLPGPLALPLARFIGEHAERATVPPSISFIESSLCLAAYISYLELCCLGLQRTTRIFKDFAHRSASYLWHMLKTVHQQMGARAKISAPYKKLFEASNLKTVERAIEMWTQARHDLTSTEKDGALAAVRLMANVSHSVFAKAKFGFFQNIQKEPFSQRYTGRFRVAHGKPPYSTFLPYSGKSSFSEAEAFLLVEEADLALPLTPFIFWYPCNSHQDQDGGHCFFFDKIKEETGGAIATYKAAGFMCHVSINASDVILSELVHQLVKFRTEDPRLELVQDLKVSDANR